jgi:hypothetical protein
MNIYVTQLKQSITAKLEQIEDAEYLSSLDAILTYETHGLQPQQNNKTSQKSFWKRLSEGFLRIS